MKVVVLFVFVLFVRGGPEGAWGRKKHICKGRAGRGAEAEAYFIGDGPVVGVVVEGGISLDISLAWKAVRLCSPFSRGCTEPLKGRERGRRIALG